MSKIVTTVVHTGDVDKPVVRVEETSSKSGVGFLEGAILTAVTGGLALPFLEGEHTHVKQVIHHKR